MSRHRYALGCRTLLNNKGLVLRQNQASGVVTYSFCSELGWSPCANPPKLTVTYLP